LSEISSFIELEFPYTHEKFCDCFLKCPKIRVSVKKLNIRVPLYIEYEVR